MNDGADIRAVRVYLPYQSTSIMLNPNEMEKIIETLERRYATKVYDPSKKITQEQLDALLQAVRLSPSSYGLQPYEVIVVLDPALRVKLREVSFGQSPVTDASALFVLARYERFPEGFIDAYVNNTIETRGLPQDSFPQRKATVDGVVSPLTEEQLDAWNKNQTYILLGTLLLTAASMELDATPMEGFDPERYDELLGLKEKGLKTAVIMAVGHHSDTDWSFGLKKIRRPLDEMVTILR